MMAVTALSLVPENTIITIKPDFLETEGDSGFYGNERWRLKDLLNLTLIESSNDGASAIADTAGQLAAVVGVTGKKISADNVTNLKREQFVAEMNRQAVLLGLTQTYFLNPTGLDENIHISGGYGSARDISALFSYAIAKYPKLFEGTRYNSKEFDSLSSLKHTVKNTNVSVDKFPSLLASKTGYTELAGGNLTIAFDAGPGRPIIVSVLGSTEQGRFEDAEKLVWATLDYLNDQ
jgi:D-alanyl-D-alanine carboxypeptidase